MGHEERFTRPKLSDRCRLEEETFGGIRGNGTVNFPRMYQLIRQEGPISDRLIEIEFLDPGAQVFDFTFG